MVPSDFYSSLISSSISSSSFELLSEESAVVSYRGARTFRGPLFLRGEVRGLLTKILFEVAAAYPRLLLLLFLRSLTAGETPA